MSAICTRLTAILLGLALLPLASTATTVVPPSFTQLVKGSDYVVQAVVKSVTAINKAPAGRRPLVYSRVELEVEQVVAGNPPSPLILEVLGGTLDGVEMHISGAPTFTVGEKAIFFVQGNGTQIFPLTRMMHGLYPIKKDPASGREYVARSNGQPMENVDQVQQPLHAEALAASAQSQLATSALSPADFIVQIRVAAKEVKASEK